MKVMCDVCSLAEATVLCCADEAALCGGCDKEVHAANKLASKHQRVPLLHRSPSQVPSCDICQEKVGHFFCLEDRALLCRQCDVGIHSSNPHVSAHQRFLVTGVRVALQQCETDNSCSSSSSGDGTANNSNRKSGNPSFDSAASDVSPARATAAAEAARGGPEGVVSEEEMGGFRAQWPWNEILAGSELEQFCEFSEFGPSPVNTE